MKTRRNLRVVLTVALGIAASCTTAWAQPPAECGLTGTWSGYADSPWPNSSIAWLSVHTPGSNPQDGEMLLNFVFAKSSLLTLYGHYAAVQLTPGHGFWTQIAKAPAAPPMPPAPPTPGNPPGPPVQEIQYSYTWYAYGISSSGVPLYSVQVSGIAQNTDCNDVVISYKYEVFDGIVAPQNMSSQTPLYTTAGSAAETRIPVVSQ